MTKATSRNDPKRMAEVDLLNEAQLSIAEMTDRQRQSLEFAVRKNLNSELENARKRLPQIDVDARLIALKFDVESEVLADEERSDLEGELRRLSAERATLQARVQLLPDRIRLYRDAPALEAPFQLGNIVRR
jgi:hypothetical protein